MLLNVTYCYPIFYIDTKLSPVFTKISLFISPLVSIGISSNPIFISIDIEWKLP